ncbi:MAG: hypothetical protein R2764_05210 [Bacteroidales bacterium]
MKPNVLDYEPGLALFVEDENPLLYYDAIADFALIFKQEWKRSMLLKLINTLVMKRKSFSTERGSRMFR